ncbi:MAG: acetylglutamate kinase [Muribaculaceae bacterium]|nr:acetylglutamate kinase [Muribaculaceae bacterium]
MPNLTIIKVGGAIVENEASLNHLLNDFANIPAPKLLVHGGGRSATRFAERLGIKTQMIDGRRVTDTPMLEVVTMVYGGLVNKNIVAALQKRGINALGVTGADLNLILSQKRPIKNGIDYGWVGDVKSGNSATFAKLLNAGIVPVLAPLSHDGEGHILNTNADTIAAQTAIECATAGFNTSLIYCFEKDGVLADANDDSSVIPTIDFSKYLSLKADGIISGGMIPKLDNAFETLRAGVKRVIITNAANIATPDTGTVITL